MNKTPAQLLQEIIIAHPDQSPTWGRTLSMACAVSGVDYHSWGTLSVIQLAATYADDLAKKATDVIVPAMYAALQRKFLRVCAIADDRYSDGSSFSCRFIKYPSSEESFIYISLFVQKDQMSYCVVSNAPEPIKEFKACIEGLPSSIQ